MNATTLRSRLAWAFVALGVLTMLGIAAFSVSAARAYRAQEEIIVDLFQAYSLSADLNQALLDQETGFRGFALAGDPAFLGPYTEGVRRAETLNRRLATVSLQFPGLAAAHQTVVDEVAAWRAAVAEPGLARLREGGEITDAQLLRAKERFDSVRKASTDYQGRVVSLRQLATEDLRSNNTVLVTVMALGVVLLVGAAALSWLALRRWVTAPLERFGAEVGRVESGDLAHAVTVEDAPREILDLADGVDRMRIRILQEFALAEQATKDAQEARQLVVDQAEDLLRSNAELEQFAYVASHDLQEPLRKVASFCQLLERRYKGQLDERGEQYIEYAVDGAKRMQRLINDLLAFSRVGRTSAAFTEVDLEVVLAQALRQLDEALNASGAEVTHDALPKVRGDASLLVQLFQNLVGNGVKFRGEEPPRVHISAREEGATWEFACSDNGIGVDPQYADKIFVIFQRLHARDAYGGTGIGLAMCKKIVEYHGGTIWLATGVDSGTTLHWTLPIDEERERADDDTGAGGSADRSVVGGGRPG